MHPRLSETELDRYRRQIIIDEIGETGQKKLKQAKVCICGAGGLASPVAIYLTAAGVGNITLVDHDQVSLNNLNRQILHSENQIDRKKVESAKEHLNQINSLATITGCAEKITENNARQLIAGHDVVIDALDNLDARYIVNLAVQKENTVFIHGAVERFEGRVMTVIPRQSTCLRCLYRGPVKKAGEIPVVGVTPAVIGALQATETIKYITGAGHLLTDRLLTYDGLEMTFKEMKLKKNPDCDHCGK